MKVLFLNCDGTLRRPASGAKFINDPQDQEAIPGASQALRNYHDRGWKCVGVINQDGVAAGHKSIESAIAEQIKTLEIFPQLECILFSPTYSGSRMILVDRHRDGSNEKIVIDIEPVGFSDSWKPAPGMLEYYLSDYCKKDYQALMVGDRPEDRDVAKAAKIPFQWANEWREDLREV